MKLRKLTSKHRSHCDTCHIQTQPCTRTHRDAETLGMFYSTPPNEIMIYVEFIFCGHLKWSEGSSGWHRHTHTHTHVPPSWSQLCDPGMKNCLWVTEAHGPSNPPAAWPDTHIHKCILSHSCRQSCFYPQSPFVFFFLQYYYNILIRSWNEVKSKQHTLPLLLLLLPVNTFPLSVTSLPEET